MDVEENKSDDITEILLQLERIQNQLDIVNNHCERMNRHISFVESVYERVVEMSRYMLSFSFPNFIKGIPKPLPSIRANNCDL